MEAGVSGVLATGLPAFSGVLMRKLGPQAWSNVWD